MKCPYCKYIHGYEIDADGIVEGKEGDFYTCPVSVERDADSYTYSTDYKKMHACPSCGKVFIIP